MIILKKRYIQACDICPGYTSDYKIEGLILG